jgi:hypothetical protein
MIEILFAGLLASTAPSIVVQDAATDRRGVAGVCIRWDGRRRSRVAESVIVRSTGNAALDQRISDAIPEMNWPVGVDDYRGQWLGIWMAVGGAESPSAAEPLPDCSGLRDRSWAPAPAAGAPTE